MCFDSLHYPFITNHKLTLMKEATRRTKKEENCHAIVVSYKVCSNGCKKNDTSERSHCHTYIRAGVKRSKLPRVTQLLQFNSYEKQLYATAMAGGFSKPSLVLTSIEGEFDRKNTSARR